MQLKAKVKLIRNFIYVNQLDVQSIRILFAQYAIEMRLTRGRSNPREATSDQVKDCDVNMFRPLPNFDSYCLIHIYKVAR